MNAVTPFRRNKQYVGRALAQSGTSAVALLPKPSTFLTDAPTNYRWRIMNIQVTNAHATDASLVTVYCGDASGTYDNGDYGSGRWGGIAAAAGGGWNEDFAKEGMECKADQGLWMTSGTAASITVYVWAVLERDDAK